MKRCAIERDLGFFTHLLFSTSVLLCIHSVAWYLKILPQISILLLCLLKKTSARLENYAGAALGRQ